MGVVSHALLTATESQHVDDPLTAAVKRAAAERAAADTNTGNTSMVGEGGTAVEGGGPHVGGNPPSLAATTQQGPGSVASNASGRLTPGGAPVVGGPLEVLDAQHMWVSLSLRAPGGPNSPVCEEPTLRRFEFCSQSGLRLANLISSLGASGGGGGGGGSMRKCGVNGCSALVGAHTRTFLHGAGGICCGWCGLWVFISPLNDMCVVVFAYCIIMYTSAHMQKRQMPHYHLIHSMHS